MYNTTIIKNPFPLLQVVWQVVLQVVLQELDDIFFHLLINYIHAPSIIISRINNTRIIDAEEPQLLISIPPFFLLFTLFYGYFQIVWVFIPRDKAII